MGFLIPVRVSLMSWFEIVSTAFALLVSPDRLSSAYLVKKLLPNKSVGVSFSVGAVDFVSFAPLTLTFVSFSKNVFFHSDSSDTSGISIAYMTVFSEVFLNETCFFVEGQPFTRTDVPKTRIRQIMKINAVCLRG